MNILFFVLPLLWMAIGAGVYDRAFGLSLSTLTQPPTSLQAFGAAWVILGTLLLVAGVVFVARMSSGNRALLLELLTALDRVPGQAPTREAASSHSLLEVALLYHVVDPFGTREAARIAEQSHPHL